MAKEALLCILGLLSECPISIDFDRLALLDPFEWCWWWCSMSLLGRGECTEPMRDPKGEKKVASSSSSPSTIFFMSSSSSMILSSSSTTASTDFVSDECLFFSCLTWSRVTLSALRVRASRAGWHCSSSSTILSLKSATTRPSTTSKTRSSKGSSSSSSSSLASPFAEWKLLPLLSPPLAARLDLSFSLNRSCSMIPKRRFNTNSSSLMRSERVSGGKPKSGMNTSSFVMMSL
mmetsp:Transcript_8294/g.20495  ORF Transcript_8294/g.20495 Transcript_8294/m.20495 type:complete len:233 (+) Transcript_8294:1336-2034(+)